MQIVAYIVFIGIALGLSYPFGKYMAKVFLGERNLLTPVMKPVENFVYRICGIDVNSEMTLKTYIFTLLGFSVVGIAFVFLVLEVQGILPLNPQGAGPFSWDLALNTAVSYVTNSNWISYVGERDLSYMAQIAGADSSGYYQPDIGAGGDCYHGPLFQPQPLPDHRQLLGRYDPRNSLYLGTCCPDTGIPAYLPGYHSEL